jgi:hypothetical protein
MSKETMFALAVSLLTWGGVWAYFVRVDLLARQLEKQARELDAAGARDEDVRSPEHAEL